MELLVTFPLSPGWPDYDINDDAKMYMQAMVFMIWLSGLGYLYGKLLGHTLKALFQINVVSN